MPTIRQCIERLAPSGTNGDGDMGRVPLWPPDVFAITSMMARLSECYTLAAVRGGMGFGVNYVLECQHIGQAWSVFDPTVEPLLQARWDILLQHGHESVGSLRDFAKFPVLIRALFELLAIADEASAGVGFGGTSDFCDASRLLSQANGGITLCKHVTADEACVQPKGRIPSVGCNLRSMSQHLALVPASSQVLTTHFEAQHPFDEENHREIGVLLVPFPYEIATDDFRSNETGRIAGQPWAPLSLGYSWHRTPIPEFIRFVAELITAAQRKGHPTHIVVFPELALSRAMWRELTTIGGPRMFVAGVLGDPNPGDPPQNLACGHFRETHPNSSPDWEQAKHHRWRVERYQVCNYGFDLRPDGFSGSGPVIDDRAWASWYGWWEDIDIQHRRVVTTRFHRGATVSTLICEDLSRVDPVQPVLRELGPTWLIALLLDGPQTPSRWAAQGAGAFADDPGSSVLVLTSLGLIQRSRDNRERRRGDSHAAIGLWRDPNGAPRVLELSASAHALHLCLSAELRRELTLDGRDDGGQAVVLKYQRELEVTVDNPPAWAKRFRPS